MNKQLIAQFAEGLTDKQTGRDVGITIRKATLRESINQAQGYASLESNMRLSREEYETAAVETAEEAEVEPIEGEIVDTV